MTPYEDMRWSRFRNFAPENMFTVVDRHVFPFLRTLGGNGSTCAHRMKDARFTIPTPQLLAKVVDLIAEVPMEDRDTKGDLYEYMLAKIATAGQNGQFRTPRHIIQLMVNMVVPTPIDVICDLPAALQASSSRRANIYAITTPRCSETRNPGRTSIKRGSTGSTSTTRCSVSACRDDGTGPAGPKSGRPGYSGPSEHHTDHRCPRARWCNGMTPTAVAKSTN